MLQAIVDSLAATKEELARTQQEQKATIESLKADVARITAERDQARDADTVALETELATQRTRNEALQVQVDDLSNQLTQYVNESAHRTRTRRNRR